MGVGAAILTGVGMAVGGYARYRRGRDEREANRNQADRAIKMAKEQKRVNKANWERAQEQIGEARERVDFQLEQTEAQAERAFDTLDFRLDQAQDEFSDRLTSLHRSKRRGVEQIHREGASATAEAAASGVRSGGAVDRTRRDIQDARSDLKHEVSMERSNMDRHMEGIEQNISDTRSDIGDRVEAAQFQADQTHSELTRRRAEARDQFKLRKKQANLAIEEGNEVKDANEGGGWDRFGDTVIGAFSGGSVGLGLSQGMSDTFGWDTFETSSGGFQDWTSGLFGD